MTLIADLLVPFCDAAALNIKDASKTLKKRFLVSLSFVDTASLHKNLFEDQYLDWNGVQEYHSEISYSVGEWWHLLKLMDFVEEMHPSHEVAELIASTFVGVRVPSSQTKILNPLETLRLCFAKVKISPSWDLLCKTFVACNLQDIDPLQMLQMVFSEEKGVEDLGMLLDLVRFLASFKHTKTEYTNLFASILSDARCKVRTHVVIQSLQRREAEREARRQNAILSGAAFKKPSLTQLLEAKLLREGAVHPQDSFASFCRLSKIASNANLRIKQTAYFLLCLGDQHKPQPQGEATLSRIVGDDQIILVTLQKMTILSPDVQELRKIIMDTQYTLKPSETLKNFRNKCISNCLVMTKGLNWNTVMRLYMAAYSRPEISKDLWCYVLGNTSLSSSSSAEGGLLSSSPFLNTSSETESTVQAFVKNNPFDLNEVIESMLADIN
jgi:hypothetical protein